MAFWKGFDWEDEFPDPHSEGIVAFADGESDGGWYAAEVVWLDLTLAERAEHEKPFLACICHCDYNDRNAAWDFLSNQYFPPTDEIIVEVLGHYDSIEDAQNAIYYRIGWR